MAYVPERNDIVFIDHEPVKGKEIGKYRPALVLSSKAYNSDSQGLLICCPISTSIRGGIFEVPVNNLEKPSVVVSNMVQTFSWRTRNTKFATQAEAGTFNQVLERLLPIVGAQELIEAAINDAQ